jgi:hypothetical protein
MDIGESAERGVEHADDFRRLVVDDRTPLAVPKSGYGDFAGIAGVRRRVHLIQTENAVIAWLEIVDRFGVSPAFVLGPVGIRHGDHVL